MSRDWKYIAFLAGSVIIYLVAKSFTPKEFDWTVTYDVNDKNPYGAYAFAQLAPSAFKGTSVHPVNRTLYELLDSLPRPTGVISLSTDFSPSKADVDALLKNVEAGGHAFIAADDFSGPFRDTLGISSENYLFNTKYYGSANIDSSTLKIVYPDTLNEANAFLRHNILTYFASYDTAHTTVLAVNDLGLPVTILVHHGSGYLVLNTTPLTFSNLGILHGNNGTFLEHELSFLPAGGDLYWTNFYQVGRLQPLTPLRVILTHEPLRWAYYVGIGALLLFLLFEMKRKQRIIPVIRPLSNTTLEFVRTIGNMYYQERDHRAIASKEIAFLLERIREKYRLPTVRLDPKFVETLALRSGVDASVVRELVDEMTLVEGHTKLSEKELLGLNEKIEKFTTLAFIKTN